jgi:HD-like signal output (HDOD) protein
VQRQVLNVDLAELEHALMQAWGLPQLLVDITNDHARQPTAQMRNVMLAIRVARHSAGGWDNPALPDDVHDIAQLLQMSADAVERLLHDIDDDS